MGATAPGSESNVAGGVEKRDGRSPPWEGGFSQRADLSHFRENQTQESGQLPFNEGKAGGTGGPLREHGQKLPKRVKLVQK